MIMPESTVSAYGGHAPAGSEGHHDLEMTIVMLIPAGSSLNHAFARPALGAQWEGCADEMKLLGAVKLARPSLRRTLLAGGAASTAYLVEQAIDRRVTRNNYDDLVLLGGMVSEQPLRQKLLGALAHYTFGTVLAAAYDAAQPSLPRLPAWLRGLAFAQVENTILFPALAVLDTIHPAVRRGALPPLWTWRYFWIAVARHAAYGIVLGLVIADPEAG
jgi:hypothetical protein